MSISDKLKLAVYLDEAGEDPVSACATLIELKIPYVILRFAWTGNICEVNDSACQRLRELLTKYNLSVVGIISELGKVEPLQLASIPQQQINRVFDIAAYFRAAFVRVHAGTKIKDANHNAVCDWMALITERCLQGNLTPLLEVTSDSYYNKPPEVAQILTKFRRWRLLYDPVQLIIKQNQDPFSRYWTLLKGFVAAIDLRDYKIGYGFKPAGFGDAKIRLTLEDATNSNYQGWYWLEPSLGRRYASAATKQGTFRLAIEALDILLD